MNNSAPRILISRLSAIGDCIHTLPVACALKDHVPDCHVGWVVQGVAGTMLEGHPAIDQVHRVGRGWLRSPSKVLELRRSLRESRYDVVLDVQSLTKSAIAGWLSGARARIGFSRPLGRELGPWLATELVDSRQEHVVLKYLEILQPLGIDEPNIDFRIPVRQAEAGNVEQWLREFGLGGTAFVVMNPGAGWDSKLWPARRYGEVAREIYQKHGLPTLVVWAGEREKLWAEEIAVVSKGKALIAPDTSLNELAEVLRQAHFFVGSDTGPLHLASAVGTPCVSMFGPTKPSICGPFGEGHISLQAYYQDGSSRERRGTDNSAMQAISVDQVVDASEELLAGIAGDSRKSA